MSLYRLLRFSKDLNKAVSALGWTCLERQAMIPTLARGEDISGRGHRRGVGGPTSFSHLQGNAARLGGALHQVSACHNQAILVHLIKADAPGERELMAPNLSVPACPTQQPLKWRTTFCCAWNAV